VQPRMETGRVQPGDGIQVSRSGKQALAYCLNVPVRVRWVSTRLFAEWTEKAVRDEWRSAWRPRIAGVRCAGGHAFIRE
jgi:hypothetical protein